MKRLYIGPTAEVVEVSIKELIMKGSRVKSDQGIDYGGIDEEGGKDPASRRRDVWEDDEEGHE